MDRVRSALEQTCAVVSKTQTGPGCKTWAAGFKTRTGPGCKT